jgi:hypothetical protein
VVYRNTLRPWRNTIRSGRTHYRLEQHTTVWRNTAVHRNTLRSRKNILRSGGTYYLQQDLSLLQLRINININCGFYKVRQGE